MDRLVEISNFFNSRKNRKILNQDDELVSIEFNPGASEIQIQEIESRYGIHLPLTLREILINSNGMDFYGLHIQSIEEMDYYSNERLLSFHSWGNGDFDCVKIQNGPSTDSIWFMNHSPIKNYLVINSLFDWFMKVYKELKSYGALLHPMDYRNEMEFNGLYKTISKNIEGV